jgi:hypothetical protein
MIRMVIISMMVSFSTHHVSPTFPVQSICTLTHRQPFSIIQTHGFFSTTTSSIYHSVRRIAHGLGGRSFVLNTVFDGLSRNVSPQELGLDPLLMYNATADDAMIQMVRLCNPADQLSDMTSHTAFLQQCTSLLLLWYPGDSFRYKHTWCNLSTLTTTWIRLRCGVWFVHQNNFMSVAFGFAHQLHLQFFECRVWFCASTTVTIFWVLRWILSIKYRHVCLIWFCASNTCTIFYECRA